MGLCGKSRAEEEALEEEKRAVAEEKRSLEEKKRAMEREKKAMEEAKKALEQEKKALEEEKRALEEQKRALDGEKEGIESEKKAVDQERKAVEEEKKVLEGEKRGIEEERKVMAETKQETAVTTRALVHEEEAAQPEEEKAEEEEKEEQVEEEKEEPPTPEFAAPDWLDVALIQKALENGGDDRQVEGLSVSIATNPGDNYASSIYRVKAELSGGEEVSFVVKGPVPVVGAADMMAALDVFKREGAMLGEIVPKMEALLEAAAPGRFPPLAARCPLHGDCPVDFLVLEDLRPAGFKMADRKRGLGLNHSLLAVRTLARFHAASHALLRKEPEVAETLKSVWDKIPDMIERFVVLGLLAAVDACRTWPGFEQYADILEEIKPNLLTTVAELWKPKPDGFKVISHGDFWVNNMLFSYEDGEVNDLRVVDLQSSMVISPALDIIYFLSTSVSENVFAHHQDLLVREYYFALQEILGLLEIQAPSLEEVQADIDFHGPSALVGTFNVVPIVKAERPLDMEAAMAGDHSAMAPLYESPLVKSWMQKALPELARKGWLRS